MGSWWLCWLGSRRDPACQGRGSSTTTSSPRPTSTGETSPGEGRSTPGARSPSPWRYSSSTTRRPLGASLLHWSLATGTVWPSSPSSPTYRDSPAGPDLILDISSSRTEFRTSPLTWISYPELLRISQNQEWRQRYNNITYHISSWQMTDSIQCIM